jgi:hypothetical protein
MILQFGGKMLETLTRLHFSIPAFRSASSSDCNFSLCLPTPFVKKTFLGIKLTPVLIKSISKPDLALKK